MKFDHPTQSLLPRFARGGMVYLTICLVAGSPFSAHADELLIAVAANFARPMQALVAQFEQDTEHTATISPGSSGKLFAQIINGAPYDVFFSADQAKPIALEQRGQIVPGSRMTYAAGQLALWSKDPMRIRNGRASLQDQTFSRLALANPKLAPYGAAARQVLVRLGLQSSEPKWVFGESVAQTYQFIATGNAELGFVALSQILHNGKITAGSAWIVPNCLHTPILQDAVILPRAANKPAAAQLMAYMSAQALPIMRSFGYLDVAVAEQNSC